MTPNQQLACALDELRYLRRMYANVTALADVWEAIDYMAQPTITAANPGTGTLQDYDPLRVDPKPEYPRRRREEAT